MKLTMLGTGAAIIRLERRSPAVLVETDAEESIIVDCGWGVPSALIELGFPLYQLDHLCLTHRHADHLAALPALIQSMHVAGISHYPGKRREKPLFLHGYPGFSQDFQVLVDMMAPDLGRSFDKMVNEYPQKRPAIYGSLTISATEVRHVPQFFSSVSFRLDSAGKSAVVSGDLGWDDRLLNLMQGVDLAVIEAAVAPDQFAREGPKPNHLSAFEAGKMAALAGIKHLVLTHLYEVDDKAVTVEVRKNFSGQLTIPEDLQVFTW